jgi:ribonuclease E
MHAREVPLPSGGRLVIDQTEALVAIDVNSGKSRGAKDAETNAYQTNLEAVRRDLPPAAPARPGRARDLRPHRYAPRKHRKDIENRFRDRLRRDRARSTTLPISDFGILEMTRQRMRAPTSSSPLPRARAARVAG